MGVKALNFIIGDPNATSGVQVVQHLMWVVHWKRLLIHSLKRRVRSSIADWALHPNCVQRQANESEKIPMVNFLIDTGDLGYAVGHRMAICFPCLLPEYDQTYGLEVWNLLACGMFNQ